jgi:hypothetical protein
LLTPLTNHTLTRFQVATLILHSHEYDLHLAATLYTTYYARSASTSELNNTGNSLQQSSDEQVITQFVASGEYYSRSHPFA